MIKNVLQQIGAAQTLTICVLLLFVTVLCSPLCSRGVCRPATQKK